MIAWREMRSAEGNGDRESIRTTYHVASAAASASAAWLKVREVERAIAQVLLLTFLNMNI